MATKRVLIACGNGVATSTVVASKVKDYCDVISTFVYRAGITNSQFARATAIGLFQSVVGLVLITGANTVSRLFDEQSIW